MKSHMLVRIGYIPLPQTALLSLTQIFCIYLERTKEPLRSLCHEFLSLRIDLKVENRPKFPCSAIARKAADLDFQEGGKAAS